MEPSNREWVNRVQAVQQTLEACAQLVEFRLNAPGGIGIKDPKRKKKADFQVTHGDGRHISTIDIGVDLDKASINLAAKAITDLFQGIEPDVKKKAKSTDTYHVTFRMPLSAELLSHMKSFYDTLPDDKRNDPRIAVLKSRFEEPSAQRT